jgi:hypothetical protein
MWDNRGSDMKDLHEVLLILSIGVVVGGFGAWTVGVPTIMASGIGTVILSVILMLRYKEEN